MKSYSYLKTKFQNLTLIPLPFFRSTNFCIWHSGRCGSTILSSMLNQHPQIYSAGEVLEYYSIGKKSKGWSGGKWLIPLKMLKGGSKVSGFEMKILHLSRLGVSVSEAIKFLNQVSFNKYIVLERQNYLRVIVSGEIAKETLQYHIKSGSTPIKHKVYINPEKLNSLIYKFLDFYTELKMLLGENCLWLLYEKDILHDPKIAYQKVTDFLELKPVEAEINLERTNPYPLEEIILNFDEISNVLEDTAFEWMLKDSL